MNALKTLKMGFDLSHLVFEPQTSPNGLYLSACFPNLTSLTVSSQSTAPLPEGWTQSLPRNLTLLDVSLSVENRDISKQLHPSAFDLLPKGLQKISLKMSISAGPMNLHQFPDLRSLTLLGLVSLEVLDSLPNSLEEVILRVSRFARVVAKVDFAHSKFPPKIRVFRVSPYGINLLPDCMAPPTLEELGDLSILCAGSLKFMHTSNLRVLTPRCIELSPELYQMLPNVKEIYGLFNGSDSCPELLPRGLTFLPANWHRSSWPSGTLKELPPSLTSFHVELVSTDDVLDLPRSVHTLSLFVASTPRLSREVCATLPPKLRTLGVSLSLFVDIANGLDALPKTLESLTLNLKSLPPDSDMVERVVFPVWMQATLKSLTISLRDFGVAESTPLEKSCVSLIPKLSSFSCLSKFDLRAEIVINSDTLANLLKSLTRLDVKCCDLTNFGLPFGRLLGDADWKEEGAFSRLPEGLVALNVFFSGHMLRSIDFNVFSNLPKRLAELRLSTSWSLPENLKLFFASLPRRLASLDYTYDQKHPRFKDTTRSFSPTSPPFSEQLKNAIEEYYSDPFWTSR